MSTAPPFPVGTTGASAARRMPLIRFATRVAPDSSAPVEPAETKASPSPAFSRFSPTVSEESFFFRKAVAGSSHISTTSLAWDTATPAGRSLMPLSARTLRMSSPLPTRMISTPYSLLAWMAPITGASGALSPPMASTMIFIEFPLSSVRKCLGAL